MYTYAAYNRVLTGLHNLQMVAGYLRLARITVGSLWMDDPARTSNAHQMRRARGGRE